MSSETDPATEPSPTLSIDDDKVAWITFDDPERPLNVLDEGVMRRLAEAVDRVRARAREGRVNLLIVRSGKPGSFIAGADVDAIEAIEDPAEAETKIKLGQAILSEVSSLQVPTFAVIDGICLGGGTELALACDYRLVSDSPKTSIGLPEVMLGILPAWGGTTRLPRTIGLQAALDLLLTGKRIDARKAKRIGFATEILPAQILEATAKEAALRIAATPPQAKRSIARRLVDDNPVGRKLVLTLARRQVMKTTGGHYPAPLRILDVLGENLGRSVEQSLAAEASAAAELVVSKVSKNLIHVFHMREAARKEMAEAPAHPVRMLGVLGAGVMGGGVAQLAAHNGVRVYMKDIQHEAVGNGLSHARSLFDKAVQRRRLSRREAAQRMEHISGGLEYHGLAAAELVVEAVVERMDVKRQVLAETERHVRADCVLATNTSSLSVDAMAEALQRPERFCGMHFFNPVHRMPLVEVVRGARSSEEALATVYRFAVELGKVPVLVNDGPGFLVNRILGPYLNEAGHLLEDGATVQSIDGTAKRFGMPMGPLRLIDEVGIDVSTHAGAALHEALGARLDPAPALVALAETGRLGRKGGRGFYLYEDGREKGVDEEIYKELRIPPLGDKQPPDAREIRRRLVVAMVNEAARALEERIVERAADVDLAMIMGTGFPPFHGGLLRFADDHHPRRCLEIARELHARLGPRFEPPELLEQLAASGRTFYEAFGG